MKDIAEKSLFDIPGGWKTLLWILVLLGIGMFIGGLMTGGEESVVRTWQAFLINTVFWGGIAHAGVCLLYTSPSPRDGLLSRMPSSA